METSFNNYADGVLQALSPDVTEQLMKAGRRVHFKDGEFVQSRGDHVMELAIILQGRVRLMTLGEDGSELLTAILGPGQQINEVTMFARTAQTHDAIAVGDTELMFLTEPEYKVFVEQYPQLIQALLVSNVQRVHQLIELLNDLRALPKSVVLARLLFKNARYQRENPSVNSVELGITQDDLAMFLGVSRSYMNKVLAQLNNLQLIKIAYRNIRVIDIDSLEIWIQENMSYDPVEDYDRDNKSTL